MADLTKTVFGDLRKQALEVYRVQTASSVYYVAFHNERGRRYVIVRGAEGSDRENVVVRDSDPRIGDESMFDVPVDKWVGQVMEAATMRTSPIVFVAPAPEADATMGAKWNYRLEVPPGVENSPRIMPGLGKGTNVVNAQAAPARHPAGLRAAAAGTSDLARQVVVGEAPLPYPLRHVRYAEDVAALLRSIHRRDRLFEDVVDPEMHARLVRALEDSEDLIRLIRRRAKK